jgi:hypothetical protein
MALITQRGVIEGEFALFHTTSDMMTVILRNDAGRVYL